MQITGEQLFFLVQVLKDSLDIQMGYDWSFNYKLEQRKLFYNKFIQLLLSQDTVNIELMDLSKIKKLE